MSDFNILEQSLKTGDYSNLINLSLSDPLISRLGQILISETHKESFYDFNILLRQILLSRIANGSRNEIIIHRQLWNVLSENNWARNCFSKSEISNTNEIVLRAVSWEPEWLQKYQTGSSDIFFDVYEGELVRKSTDVRMDPALSIRTRFPNYTSPGQAAAVRSLMYMPLGSTLVVNLPTGSGKTLVAQTPIILDGPDSGLTLVIVPTTALAIDQARQIRDIIKHNYKDFSESDFSYYSGMLEEKKKQIRQRIRAGTQGILFTSPESVLGGLSSSIWDACKKGTLKYFVIDEAHIVSAWGDGFRPDFQLLAGFRNGLLRQCGQNTFETLLLSATLSKNCISDLRDLFGNPGPFQVSSAVHLRPEPRYLSFKACSIDEKNEKIEELLRFAPRPLIFYLNSPGEVEEWKRKLFSFGSKRFACFHGKTPNDMRLKIINDWMNDKYDIIIATSAFGVGMDKSNIKTIIHGMVSDSLDQFYQEVGRAGRDGTTCASVCIFSYEDVQTGQRKAIQKTIGSERAYERWNAMFNRARLIEDGLIELDNAILLPDLRQDSEENEQWNFRVLTTMSRAGFLALDANPPEIPIQEENEEETAYEERCNKFWDQERKKTVVKILNAEHTNDKIFYQIFERVQDRRLRERKQSYKSLLEILQGDTEMKEGLSKLYQNQRPSSTEAMVVVSKTCRGCPSTPFHKATDYSIPFGTEIKRIKQIDITKWNNRFGHLGSNPLVSYSKIDSGLNKKIKKFIEILLRQFEICEIVSSPELLDERWFNDLLGTITRRRVIVRNFKDQNIDLMSSFPIPRVTILFNWEDNDINDFRFTNSQVNILVIPDDLDGALPGRLLLDTEDNVIKLTDFLRNSE